MAAKIFLAAAVLMMTSPLLNVSNFISFAFSSPFKILAAGFVDKEGKNVGNITGTSDLVLADKQLKLIRQMMPKAKNVGIFCNIN